MRRPGPEMSGSAGRGPSVTMASTIAAPVSANWPPGYGDLAEDERAAGYARRGQVIGVYRGAAGKDGGAGSHQSR